MRRKAFALSKLYDGLISISGEEILPSYAERPRANFLKPLKYLDGVDGRIEQLILSHTDRNCKGLSEGYGSALKLSESELELCKSRQKNLADTLNKIQNHIRRLQSFERRIMEKILSQGLNGKLHATGTRLKDLVGKYDWLNRLLSDYGVILMKDEKIFEEDFKTECRKVFGARLRQARQAAGETMEAIAKKIGLSRSGYINYELGYRDLPTATIYRLAKILNVETDWLFGLKD